MTPSRWWRLQRWQRRLTYAQVITTIGTIACFIASVCLMIAESAPVRYRLYGAIYLAGIALYGGIFTLQYVRIFHMMRTIESQQRTINSQEQSIESLRIIRKRRGGATE